MTFEPCEWENPDGSFCDETALEDSKYCELHSPMAAKKASTPGRKKKLKQTYGLHGSEAQSYQEFLADAKPHELHRELAQLRALLAEYRKAYHAAIQADSARAAFLAESKAQIASYLIEEREMSPRKAEKIADVVSEPLGNVYDEQVGVITHGADYVKTVRTILKDIALVAEKAKKIRDGMTFKVEIDDSRLLAFARDVVLSSLKRTEDIRALVSRMQSFMGDPSVAKALLPVGMTSDDIEEADFEELDDD